MKKVVIGASVLVLGILLFGLRGLQRLSDQTRDVQSLTLYSAAGMRQPLDVVIAAYESYYLERHGTPIRIEVHYAGSGTLLSQLQVRSSGDLFLAADQSYLDRARELGVVQETIPLARMTPVIAMRADAIGQIGSLSDLMAGDWRYAIGTPGGPAIGTVTEAALEAKGAWERFKRGATVTKPTVNDLATDVRIGAADATIIWDVIARQYDLAYVTDTHLDQQGVDVAIGVLAATEQPTAALHFARFLAAPEKGGQIFADHGFYVKEGDRWRDRPEVNFFSGGVNRRALEPILQAFQKREGVRINTVYQGCGALNAQLSTIRDQNPDAGFPDGYLLCDVYYLSPVEDWFERGRAVSSTPIVIVTQKGNPHEIESLEDLTRPGIRLVLGNPTHSTIGGLTDRLLKAKGVYERIQPNVAERQPSSGMLVPPVVSGAADATLAYYSDTLPQRERLHVIRIDSEYAQAVQPFTVAYTSQHKELMYRLYDFIGRSEEIYAELGFGWKLGRDVGEFEVMAPAGARAPQTGGNR